MQHIDLEVIQQALGWIKQRRPVWLCTVLSTYGSSPRAPGSMMSTPGGTEFSGSLSGGCVEEDFLARLSCGEFMQSSQIVNYGSGSLNSKVALPCGGSLELLVEYLPDDQASFNYLQQMKVGLTSQGQWCKTVILPGVSLIPEPCIQHLGSVAVRQGETVTIYLGAITRVIIAGLSSVGQYCAQFAKTLGFEVIVCEPREEVAANFQLGDIRVQPIFPAKFIEQGGAHMNTAIIASTHDPRIDDLTMLEAVQSPAFYIGAMGSNSTSSKRKARLSSIGKLTAAELDRIHAPIGLPIGSKTPAEIAIAIVADIIRVKNGRSMADLPTIF